MGADRAVIRLEGLTKRYGRTLAVDGLTFDVRPGHVTGFLGPNGAGKSTTMRLILGLDAPTAGTVTIGGVHYRRMRRPLHQVGATLEAAAVHPGRSARAPDGPPDPRRRVPSSGACGDRGSRLVGDRLGDLLDREAGEGHLDTIDGDRVERDVQTAGGLGDRVRVMRDGGLVEGVH